MGVDAFIEQQSSSLAVPGTCAQSETSASVNECASSHEMGRARTITRIGPSGFTLASDAVTIRSKWRHDEHCVRRLALDYVSRDWFRRSSWIFRTVFSIRSREA